MPLLRLLGLPVLELDTAEPLALERKDAAWLALLALDGPAERSRLAAWLWPEVGIKTAAGSLRQRIFRLRRKSGHELVRAAETVQLLTDVRVELPPPRALPEVADAPLLAGLEYPDCPEFDDWLRRQRTRRRTQRLSALADAAARHEAAGELDAALACAHALAIDEPLSEHALRRSMRLHYLRGDRAAAVATFEGFERLLKDEIGTRPSAETLELLAMVERAGPPAAPVPRSAVPATLLRPPRLVGRERELAAIAQAWEAGRIFLLLGEAGIGKTRLLTEFAALRGRACLRVAARPNDGAVPFALLARLLRALRERIDDLEPEPDTRRELVRLLPELASSGAPPGESQRFLLQRAVRWLLEAAGTRGLTELLLDDLHFADAASLDMLQALLAGDRPSALRWGLAQRGGEGGAVARAFHDALAETQRLAEMAVAPLGVAAMRELIESLALAELDAAPLAVALVRHTGGNPLFALETLKDMVLVGIPAGGAATALPQPTTVGSLIERRLRTLSAPALALARVAAVAGVDFDIELAEHVMATPAVMLADAWNELQAAQVLAGSAFAHDLVFDAVQRSVPPEIARHLHAAVAAKLARMAADPAAVAEHWSRGARPAEAALAWSAAAARAAQAGRTAEAYDFHERAAAAHAAAGEASRAFAALAAAETAAMATLAAPALREWVARVGRAAATPHERAQATALEAIVCNQLTDAEGAERAAEAARRAAIDLGDALLALRATRSLALAQNALGRSGEAAAALEQALADPQAAAALGAAEAADLRCDFGYLLVHSGRCRQAVLEYDASFEAARQCGAWVTAANALSNAAVACALMGRMAEALQRQERALALPREDEGDSLARAIDQLTRGALLTELGRLGEALQCLEETESGLRDSERGHWATLAAGNLVQLWLALGQPARALAVTAAFERAAGAPKALEAASFRLRIARVQGQPQAKPLAQVQALLGSRVLPTRQHLALQCELAAAQPPASAALRLLAIADEATAREHFGLAATAWARRIAALTQAAEPELAAAAAREALAALMHTQPYDLYLPELWLNAARALAAVADAAAARECLAAGRAWISAAARGLPDELREAFLQRNRVNRELLALAQRE